MGMHAVPEDLKELGLYAEDAKLCERWALLLPAWRVSYPGVNIMSEVRKAHAWEVSNPTRKKVNRARFLNNWLARAQDSLGATKFYQQQRGFRPEPIQRPKCPNCSDTGKVPEGVGPDGMVFGACRFCQKKEVGR